MGFRFRKSFKTGPFRTTVSKSGISHSIGTKGIRVTKTANGSLKTTVSIPGSGISYTSESARNKKKNNTVSSNYKNYPEKCTLQTRQQTDKRSTNPPKPPKSPGIYKVCGIMMIILGAFMLFVFWPFGLLVFGIGLYYVICGPKIYKKLVENYKSVHPEFREKM